MQIQGWSWLKIEPVECPRTYRSPKSPTNWENFPKFKIQTIRPAKEVNNPNINQWAVASSLYLHIWWSPRVESSYCFRNRILAYSMKCWKLNFSRIEILESHTWRPSYSYSIWVAGTFLPYALITKCFSEISILCFVSRVVATTTL